MKANRPITYSIAMSAARDAADRQMRKEGRTVWALKDYQLACATFEKLYGNQRNPE